MFHRSYLNFYDKNIIYLAYHRMYISCAIKYSSCDTRCSLLFLWQVIYFLWQEILFYSKEKCIVTHAVTEKVPPIIRSTVWVTWRIFSVTEMIFHFASSQEIYFLWDKAITFFCDTGCTSPLGGNWKLSLKSKVFKSELWTPSTRTLSL